MTVFPGYATEEQLKLFTKLNLKGKDGIPQEFRNFCQAAIDSKRAPDQVQTSVECAGTKAYFIEGHSEI